MSHDTLKHQMIQDFLSHHVKFCRVGGDNDTLWRNVFMTAKGNKVKKVDQGRVQEVSKLNKKVYLTNVFYTGQMHGIIRFYSSCKIFICSLRQIGQKK